MDYIFCCENPRCGAESPPRPDQLPFIERSAKKGVKFIMLECPACGWSQPFNPQHPRGVRESKAKRKESHAASSDSSALQLPQYYLRWLEELGGERRVQDGDRAWCLADPASLGRTVSINGQEAPYVRQAELYAAMLADVMGMSSTADQDGNSFAFARLAECLAIGEDNEDLLLVDPSDNHSVWWFFPSEGGDVERRTDTLESWIAQVEPVE